MNTDRIFSLRTLWKEAFGDTDVFLDSFFSTAFSPDRYHCLLDNNIPVSALYWLPCSLESRSIAYVYAIATKETHRGQGLCHRLMEETHQILQQQGYEGAILVPANPELFSLYGKLGYRVFCTCWEFVCEAADTSVPLRTLNVQDYACLRTKMLPKGGVTQEDCTLRFLQEQLSFYAGDGFLLAATVEDGVLFCKELLGDTSLAAEIIRTLGCSRGRFRTPGSGRDFAMFLPLTEDCPTPEWFGLALD
ncbi:MAG: GNAT family N-acetyltransferase [Oscillospiraceae bacterium]|nr:GNAT family N-acetyltransferase [Oscillospiraceae bacterium]